MKKILILLAFLSPLFSLASIDTNLKYGMTNTEVSELQDFLTTKGLMNQSTGFFGLVTLNAVKQYQINEGIQSTGYVGVLTRTSINKDLAIAVGASDEAEIAETGTTTTSVTACTNGALFNIFTGKTCSQNVQANMQSTITTAVNAAVTQAMANQQTQVTTPTQPVGAVVQATSTPITPVYMSPTDYFSLDSISPETMSVNSGNNIPILTIVVGSYNATSTLDTFKVKLNQVGSGHISNAYLYKKVWDGNTSTKIQIGSTPIIDSNAIFSGLNQNLIPKNLNYEYFITVDATGPIVITPKMFSFDQILKDANGENATISKDDVIGNQITITE